MNSLSILLVAFVTTAHVQSTVDTLILTKEQNERWILNLEKESKPEQLKLIRKRIVLDTNIYINEYYADRIKIDNDKLRGKRSVAYGRPLLVFNQSYAVSIGNQTKGKSVLELSQLLTDEEIVNISLLKGIHATAIYGSSGKCGVIMLTTSKKTLTKISRIKL